MKPEDAAKATLDNSVATTGRDGAIDFAVKTSALELPEPPVPEQSDAFPALSGLPR